MRLEAVGRALRRWFSKAERVVIIGVGNPLRRDDSVGVEIVHRLEGKVSERVYLVDSETVPEDYIEPISDFRPTHILIIDAALIGTVPGAMRLVRDWKDSGTAVSTHALPLQLFCTYLVETTGARIAMLLIQPKEVDFGEGLTPELKETADKLASYLLKIPGLGCD